MATDSEKLFLLEVLVDKVVVQKQGSLMERLNSQNDWGTGELCVTFQFLHYPHLEICEKDFACSKGEEKSDTKTSFKSGKSCLFAVPTCQLDALPEQFALNVGVLRKMPTGVLPDKLLIAQTKIELIEPLCSIIKDSSNPCKGQDVPVSRTIKDCFCLMDPAGTKTIGSICVFVRLTCCGKSIVTQFQVGGETEEATLFKGNESNKVYQFTNLDNRPPPCHPMCPWLYQLQQMQCQQPPCSCLCPEPTPPPPCCPPEPEPCCKPAPAPCCKPAPAPCRPPPPAPCCPPPPVPAPCCPRPPSPCCDILPPPAAPAGATGECYCCNASTAGNELPQKLYEEIGAEINGHELIIKVKKDNKRKLEDDDDEEMCCPSRDDVCCEPGPPCPQCSSLEVRPYGIKDAAGFAMKFPQKGKQKLCYKLRGCPGEQQETPCKCGPPGDVDQEAFVLRIAKDKKSHLEFELKTPKKKEPPPPITTENKDTQYLLSDLKKDSGKKGKGGKKKGKK